MFWVDIPGILWYGNQGRWRPQNLYPAKPYGMQTKIILFNFNKILTKPNFFENQSEDVLPSVA